MAKQTKQQRIEELEEQLLKSQNNFREADDELDKLKELFPKKQYSLIDDGEVLEKVRGLQSYRQRTEGAMLGYDSLLKEENKKLWHLVRVSLNDPTQRDVLHARIKTSKMHKEYLHSPTPFDEHDSGRHTGGGMDCIDRNF